MNPGYHIEELPYCQDSRRLFARLRALEGSFLLYSGRQFSREGCDIMGALPAQQVRLPFPDNSGTQDLLSAVDGMIASLTAHKAGDSALPLPGWYGLMSYDAADTLHFPGSRSMPSLDTPQLDAGFYPVILVTDHHHRRTCLIRLPGEEARSRQLAQQLALEAFPDKGFALLAPFTPNLTPDQYRSCFSRIQHYLHAGDCYQVNLAQRFRAAFSGEAWAAFEHLSTVLPAPMSAYFQGDDYACLSLSPERFLAIRDGRIETRPIKGTRPRSLDPDIDEASRQELLSSPKDRAENLMIVDLLRNDLGISCVPGSIRVSELFALESYANVHHLVSTIEGRLRPEVHPLRALVHAFPGGSITGAPKRRAMEIIAELEPDNRSFYCGCAFYCDVGGKLDSSILIRTLVARDQQIYCWGGGGIVVDSTWEQEYQETLDKVGLLLRTLEQA